MRHRTFALALAASTLLVACGGDRPADTPPPRAATTPASDSQNRAGAANRPDLGVVSSHGGGASTPATTGGAAPQPDVPTPDMDARIEKAEAKAKAAGANEADRKAAAAAYFERADFFYNAGNPTLYKFALRDYRIGLRYDSTATDARAKMEEIESIYRSMGRPVPDLGNEQ